jgi:hypothetical protein
MSAFPFQKPRGNTNLLNAAELSAQTLPQSPKENSPNWRKDPLIFHRLRMAQYPWRWQLLQLFIAFGILSSIGSILGHFSGEQQPQWLQTVTLNSLIATLATLLRNTLVTIVDEGKVFVYQASRKKTAHMNISM